MNAANNAKVLQFGKYCPRCDQTKPVSEFYSSKSKFGDGFTSRCKACDVLYQRQRAEWPKTKAWRKPYNFNASVKSRYGITGGEAREMLKRQFGLCANRGCGLALSFDVERGARNRAQIDHCHKSGKVRGILCRRCNTGAAILERDENIYLGLLEYVASFPQQDD